MKMRQSRSNPEAPQEKMTRSQSYGHVVVILSFIAQAASATKSSKDDEDTEYYSIIEGRLSASR